MTDERITPYKGKPGSLPKTSKGLEPRWLRWQWLRRSPDYADSLNQLYGCEPGPIVLAAFCNAFALSYGEPPHPADDDGWRKLESDDESWNRLQDKSPLFVQVDGGSVSFHFAVPDGRITAEVCDQIIAQVQEFKDRLTHAKEQGGQTGQIDWGAQFKALKFYDAGGSSKRGGASDNAERQQDWRDRKIIRAETEHIFRQVQQWRNGIASVIR